METLSGVHMPQIITCTGAGKHTQQMCACSLTVRVCVCTVIEIPLRASGMLSNSGTINMKVTLKFQNQLSNLIKNLNLSQRQRPLTTCFSIPLFFPSFVSLSSPALQCSSICQSNLWMACELKIHFCHPTCMERVSVCLRVRVNAV